MAKMNELQIGPMAYVIYSTYAILYISQNGCVLPLVLIFAFMQTEQLSIYPRFIVHNFSLSINLIEYICKCSEQRMKKGKDAKTFIHIRICVRFRLLKYVVYI